MASRYSWSMPMYLALPRRASSRVAIVSIDFASSSSVRPYTSSNGITDSLQLSPTAVIGTHSRNGRYGILGLLAVSLRLDAGELDHLAPLLGFVCDHLGELSRRSRQRLAAEVSETGLHLGVVESRVDLLVELVDDLGRRGPRCADAEPTARLVASDKFPAWRTSALGKRP